MPRLPGRDLNILTSIPKIRDWNHTHIGLTIWILLPILWVLRVSTTQIYTSSLSLVVSLLKNHYLRGYIYDTLFTGQGDGTICFHCGGGLKNWRPADDAWKEHALWFPYCVHIRYIKGEEFIRECRNCCLHSCNHTALTCFSETAAAAVAASAAAGRPQASRHLPGTSSFTI